MDNQYSPIIFQPKPNQTQWWVGDPENIPIWDITKNHPAILIIRDLLSPELCQKLCQSFENSYEKFANRDGNEFWDGRYIWMDQLPNAEIDSIRIMQQIRQIATLQILQSYAPEYFVYSDTAQLVKWTEGQELTPHADNIEPDGKPNTTPKRAFSSVLYLNDDYEGGETYFPGHNVRFKPKAGTMVLFGSGAGYVHGVTKVKKGVRYMYAGWFTFESDARDFSADKVF